VVGVEAAVTTIFVFGSNLQGIHGAGSAKFAADFYGAVWGVGEGRTGNAYAIPTRERDIYTSRPLPAIQESVNTFLAYAQQHPRLAFDVVAIGCGNAGYTPEQMAPMFAGRSVNVFLPQEFHDILERGCSKPDKAY
jgi:hypothetical protein